MINLDLKYEDACDMAREGSEDRVVDLVAETLARNALGRGGRLGLYGSSWTGHLMARAVERLGGEVRFVIENHTPCRELEHLPHYRAAECGQRLDEVDHLILATSPRHYPTIIEQLRGFLPEDKVVLPYRNTETALVLIDVWDEGKETCPYCHVVPGLLDAARKHGLLRVHAPTFDPKPGSLAFQAKKSRIPNTTALAAKWPPADFLLRQNKFEHLNARYTRHGETTPPPLGIHTCARPVPSDRELVVNDLETLLPLFERERILHVLYCGGGTLACLAFKPCGYLNVIRAGYFPLLIEDATHQKPRRYKGEDRDMIVPGIVTFQDRGGYTTTSDRLFQALDNQG